MFHSQILYKRKILSNVKGHSCLKFWHYFYLRLAAIKYKIVSLIDQLARAWLPPACGFCHRPPPSMTQLIPGIPQPPCCSIGQNFRRLLWLVAEIGKTQPVADWPNFQELVLQKFCWNWVTCEEHPAITIISFRAWYLKELFHRIIRTEIGRP